MPGATSIATSMGGSAAAIARGLPRWAACRSLFGAMTEAGLLVMSLFCLAVGAAAAPSAVVALAGKAGLITGDQPGLLAAPARCRRLLHMFPAPTCSQALGVHHLAEVIRAHLLVGAIGFVALALWWAVHVERRRQPAVLGAEFTLAVSGTLLGAIAMPLVALGAYDVVAGASSADGLIGSADLVATGGTVLTAAVLCWAALAWQATRPARSLSARPDDPGRARAPV